MMRFKQELCGAAQAMNSTREIADAYFMLSEVYHSTASRPTRGMDWRSVKGRAKDGIDRTDPLIVKMFHMSPKKSGLDFQTVDKR